jgi:predicted negative regulator of RcsB-dependent stress response
MVEDYSDREQEELLRNWLRDNWRWMLGGIALGVAMLVAWNYWGTYREQRAAKAAVLAEDVRKAIEANDADKAGKLVADLTAQFRTAPYTQEARLQLAKMQVIAGKYDEATGLLSAVAKDSDDDELRRVAQLRHARILMQQGKHDQALALLKPDDSGEFSAVVQEVRGDALFAKGDSEGARAAYAAALKGTQTAVDRRLVELKLQEAGGTPPPAETQTTAKAEAGVKP